LTFADRFKNSNDEKQKRLSVFFIHSFIRDWIPLLFKDSVKIATALSSAFPNSAIFFFPKRNEALRHHLWTIENLGFARSCLQKKFRLHFQDHSYIPSYSRFTTAIGIRFEQYNPFTESAIIDTTD
jgi:hypothetical protein